MSKSWRNWPNPKGPRRQTRRPKHPNRSIWKRLTKNCPRCWASRSEHARRASFQIPVLGYAESFVMHRLLAIAKLTLKAAFRYRLVQILIALLLGAVMGLPAIIKHDGTAQGFTQILLTYTLGTITTLLGSTTLWLACGTLARDVEECQMQMVAVKPIARWEIWLGKWTGIMFLNLLLLALSGVAVYFLMQWRAGQLSPETQQQLRTKFFTAQSNPSGTTYFGVWEIGPPNGRRYHLEQPSLAAETFHEFPLPPNLLDENGDLYIGFANLNSTALLFPLDEGIEVLYPESGFGLNF